MNALVLPALALIILVGVLINAWLIFRGPRKAESFEIKREIDQHGRV